LFGLVGLVVLAGVAWYGWCWYTRPSPPELPAGISDGRVAKAIEEARQQVLEERDSGESWGRLGMVLQVHGYTVPAVVCYTRAQRLDPDEPRWPYYHGLILLRENAGAAIDLLRRAAEFCPDSLPGPRLRVAELLLEQGYYGEAESYLRQALGRDPADPRAHLGLGRLAQLRGDWEESVRHLERSALSPFAQKASFILLVAAYERLGQKKQAAEALRRANSLADDPPWSDPLVEQLEPLGVSREMRLLRANRLLQLGRVGEAIGVLRAAVRDHPDALCLTNLGRALIEAHRLGEAERMLRRAVREAKSPVDAHFYLGVAMYLQGEKEIQSAGESVGALAKIASAAACFDRVLRLKRNHAFAYYNLGHCRKLQGKLGEAVRAFRAAVRCKPEFADAYTNLAEVLARQGQDAAAAYWVGGALNLAPHADPGPRRLLARLLGRSIFWK
jgi:tetratricopeptide (TPR) repeat protein